MNRLHAKILEKFQTEAYNKFSIPLDQIKLLNTRRCKLWLQNYMKKSAEDIPLFQLNNEKMKPEVDKIIAENFASDQLLGELPTPYEDPFNYMFLKMINKSIEDSLKDISIKENNDYLTLEQLYRKNYSKLVFGTVPSNKINAQTYFFPSSDEYLVTFDTELFLFCKNITKIIVKIFNVKLENGKFVFEFNPDNFDKISKNQPEFYEQFKQIIISYLTDNKLSTEVNVFLNPSERFIWNLMGISIETFAFGHEYGHIIRGHVKYPEENIPAAVIDQEYIKIIYRIMEELEADQLGMSIALVVLEKQKVSPLIIGSGIELFFSLLDIMEEAVYILQHADRNSQTQQPMSEIIEEYPPSKLRRKKIRELMIQKYGKESIILSDSVERIVEILWKETKEYLIKKHDKIKISQRWI